MVDRGAAALLKLAAGLALFLVATAWVASGPLALRTGEAMRQGVAAVVIPGRTMATEVVALRGLPVYVFVVGADEFWVYDSRTRADLQNLAELGRGVVPTLNGSREPSRIHETAILRFDRGSGRLKGVHRH